MESVGIHDTPYHMRPSVRHHLDLRDGWTDFLYILHGIGPWCEVDAHLFFFVDIIQNGRSAAIFNAHHNISVICHHLNLRDGQTDFLEILHEIGTWYRVDAHLF